MQQLKALKDAAKNEGALGASMGMFTGMNFGQNINQTQNQAPQQQQNTPAAETPMDKLKKLKELFELELITEEEYTQKKQTILDSM